jgi:phage terminase small subunit
MCYIITFNVDAAFKHFAQMNRRLTPKQEAFAAEYVAIGNASEAYRRSYDATNMQPATIHARASELLNHGRVAVRIAELKAGLATDNEITFGEIAAALRATYEAALKANQCSAAVSACMGLARLGGLLVEKRQVSIDDYGPSHLDAVRALAAIPPLKK